MESSRGEAKVVLVTGSSSGIGAAAIKLFARKGYKVAVAGSRQEKVDKVARECGELSPQKYQPLALVLDFGEPANGKLAVERTVEHFGRLDVLVNNAGLFAVSPVSQPAAYEAYRKVMSVNTDAAVQAALAAVEPLRRTKGNMIFVSSVASIKPAQHGFAYCMSKASLSILAKCLAVDLAPDVRVNVVSPGPVSTPIFERVGLSEELVQATMGITTLQNRVGHVDEIAVAIAFLASDEASFVNGHEMVVDGGYLVKPSATNVDSKIIEAKKKALAGAAQAQT